MQMRRLKLDRIASSTRNAQLRREVVVGDELIAREGYILAVRVLQNKFAYDTVEDVTGRMIKVKAGDILAGVLGYRRALRGYAGIVPDKLAVGDKLHILNLGGVLGICTAGNPELGPPFEVEVLGAVLTFPDMGDRVGEPAHIYTSSILPANTLNNLPPLIMIAGTSMNSGKTFAATELVRVLSKQGRNVAACKLTGVSLMRDMLSMGDAGAIEVMDFTQAGIASTRGTKILPVARGILQHLAKSNPDLIVAELGDGILGEYGVDDILSDEQTTKFAACHIVCAPDPVAAYGAVQIYRERFHLPIHLFTGPVTDNAVGSDFIRDKLGIEAINARHDIDRLVDVVTHIIEQQGAKQ